MVTRLRVWHEIVDPEKFYRASHARKDLLKKKRTNQYLADPLNC